MRRQLLACAVTASTLAVAIALPPTVPTFVNGLAQPVFSTNPADWHSGEVWVQAQFDSDGDGVKDRIHADFSAPREVVTEGLRVPVIFEDSPYYAGTAPLYSNWGVDHELGFPPAERPNAPFWAAGTTSPTISTRYESTWVPRGFAVVHAESPGTGHSDGCPTSGGTNETLAAKAVIDWLGGRAPAYTSRDGDQLAPATWTTGKVGMIGTSYNGTLPIAAATTGVRGLEAIVPISAISDWYDYYRANGMVRAPHSSTTPSGSNNEFQGEDLDVLADVVYSRADEVGARTICEPVVERLEEEIDRASGDRNADWEERNYMSDVRRVRAATLLAHGLNDFNVMTKNAAQLYAALKAQNVPHMIYLHQGGHGGPPPDVFVNTWFSRYLYGVDNAAEELPRAWIQREAGACPPRRATVTGDQSATATLAVADTSALSIGFTLTVPLTNADGTTTNVTRLITAIPDATHVVLSSAVATVAGQKVADGATVAIVCSAANPTPYADWPDPAASDVRLHPTPGGTARGGLAAAASSGAETLVDAPGIAGLTSANAAASDARLLYQTAPLAASVRISGTPTVSLDLASSRPRANVTAALVSYAPSGAATILTRGWIDPRNRLTDWGEAPLAPGRTYTLRFDMQPKDSVVPAGNRLALMVLATDRDFTIRPSGGTTLTLDLAQRSLALPVVGGEAALAAATG